MRTIYLFCLLILTSLITQTCTSHKALINYDASLTYNPEKSFTSYKYLDTGDSIRFFVLFENNSMYQSMNEQTFRQSFQISYGIFPNLQTKRPLEADSLHSKNSIVKKEKNAFLLIFGIKKINEYSNLSIILYKNDLRRNFIDTDFLFADMNYDKSNKNLIIKNESQNSYIIKNYLPIRDSLKVIIGTGIGTTVSVSYIKNTFAPALPPHKNEDLYTRPPTDTTFQLNISKTFVPFKLGVYTFKENQNQGSAYPLVISKGKYPKLTTAEEMIAPLVYITNKTDFQKLCKSSNPKSSLDSFWLRIGDNKDYTRALIKSYYEKVEYANQAFTSYKEGWKTDRGMIYIVYGKPDEVYKSENSEEWVYTNVLSKMLTFTFSKSTTDSYNDDFVLRRGEVYQEAWYSAIEKWRNGTIKK